MRDFDPFDSAIEKLQFKQVLEKIASICLSEPGVETTRALYPLVTRAEVIDELGRVGEMSALRTAEDHPPINSLPDCSSHLHRAALAGSVLEGSDIIAILHLMRTARILRSFFEKRLDKAPLLAGLTSTLFSDKLLEYHTERIVDEDGAVRDSASKELRLLRREILEKSAQLRRKMESILKRVSEEEFVQEELVTLRDGRMVLPVKREYKRQIQGLIHSESATGQTVFIEPMETLELNNDIRDLQFEEAREVRRILAEVTDRIRPHGQELLQAQSVYAELDSLQARARYLEQIGGCLPGIVTDRTMHVREARHPILLSLKGKKDVVPLAIELGNDVTTIIITGPNAGGKSVAMKTVGLLALMVQSGIPVPCDPDSRFPIYDSIHVDIGDEQSVENDLSTFSSHVQRLAHILSHANRESLVLIDEIGTGTDPVEGSALGAAILETLAECGAHVIATTHHGMLKALAHDHRRMLNAAMEFDMQTLQPTYRFQAGIPGSSYAFEITRRIGMRENILSRATDFLGERSDSLEKLLVEVERQSQELAKQKRQFHEEQSKYERLYAEYTEKRKELKQKTGTILREAQQEAERIIADSHALIEKTVREIRESSAEKEVIQSAREKISRAHLELKQKIGEHAEEQMQPIQTPIIHAGDDVILRSSGMKGKVLEEPHEGKAMVAFGSVKMKVPVSDLEYTQKTEAHGATVYEHEKIASTEVDVRGMYGDDAVKTVDQFLYEAYSSGLKRVDIIHGKGTGALRKRLHEFLPTLSIVESFRLGEWNEGTTGVTVVFLRD